MESIVEVASNITNSVDRFQLCLLYRDALSCFEIFDAMTSTIWLMVIVIVYSFSWSIIGSNCSKVDQLWSIIPVIYAWIYWLHFSLKNGDMHCRLTLICVCITLWGVRLTYNFWRRGGYGNFITHDEDYRWPILRSKINPYLFLIFNLTFIATYQNVLLWFIVTPLYVVGKQSGQTIDNIDIALAFLFVCLLIIETVADQQQYNFQEYKHSLSESQRKSHALKDIRDGFLQHGLFKYSRHPNYFAEQSLWICVYLFSVHATGEWWNLSGLGCIQLLLLFQGSMAFSEGITLSKYPEYENYQNKVSKSIPLL